MDQALAVLNDLAASPHTAHHVALQARPPLRRRRSAAGAGGAAAAARSRARAAISPRSPKTLVLAPEAWSPDAAKFKTPYEFVVSAWRAAGVAPSALPQVGRS